MYFLKSLGDPEIADGWWFGVNTFENLSCSQEGRFSIDNDLGMVYIGADDSIFESDLNISLTLTGFGWFAGETEEFSVTLHPCPVSGPTNLICAVNHGNFDYVAGDVLTITDGVDSASVQLTQVVGGSPGRIGAFEVLSNTFTSDTPPLSASGGTGTGATLRNTHFE
jgi:hypothetical protein